MNSEDNYSFSIPLGGRTKRQAKEFADYYGESPEAQRVYVNTLAVLAVNFFLKCMGIESDLSASDSWDIVMQALLDVADLEVPNLGKLECRPVLAGAEVMRIPLEVSTDRIGYIAVRLDQSLSEATLVGFTSTASTEEIPLNQLGSVRDLLEHLSQIRQSNLAPSPTEVNLGQWLQNLFEPGWQSIQELFRSSGNQLATGLRGNAQLSGMNIERGKVLNLGLRLGSKSVALLVGIVNQVEQELEILVQVRPYGGERYLPPGLRLVLFSAQGEMMKEVISRSQDICILMDPILASAGESFSIQVAIESFSITETFVV